MDLMNWWQCGRESSLLFWIKWVRKNFKKGIVKRPLEEYLHFMIGDKKEIYIADLGCGIFSLIGNTYKNVKIYISPSDLLSNDYKKIYKRFKFIPLIPVKKQNMERITYRNNTFDIVHCSNALDHCFNPYKAIMEMIRVCKPGGWIYLRHFPYEGRRMGYIGFHKWSIESTKNNKDCIFWNEDSKIQKIKYFDLNNMDKSTSFLLSEFPMKFTIERNRVFVIAYGQKE